MTARALRCLPACLLLITSCLVPLDPAWVASGAPGPRAPVSWSNSSIGLPTAGNYYGIDFGDVSGDGKVDIVVAAESQGIKVYLGDGEGCWTAASPQPPTTGGNDLRLGDIDGDGKLDIVSGTQGQGSGAGNGMHVYKGSGTGTFTEITSGSGLPTTGVWRGIELGDFNKDTKLDIASTSGYANTDYGLRAYTGDGTGKFVNDSSGLPQYEDRDSSVAVADFDGDGNLDIAAGGAAGVDCFLGNGGAGGAMSWTRSSTGLPDQRFSGVTAADINNDDRPDIIVGAYGSGQGVRAFRNVNSAASWTASNTGLTTNGNYIDVAAADFDGDGNIDLVAGQYGTNRGIDVFYGKGDGNWTENSTGLPSGDTWVAVEAADFNGDNAPDFGVTSYSGRGVWAYRNLAFVPPKPLLNLTLPSGNVTWTGGSVHELAWNLTNGTPPYTLNISSSTDGGQTFPDRVASDLPQAGNGTGSYLWTVPPIDGTLRLRFDARDARNQTAFRVLPWNVSVDSTLPEVNGTLPADGAAGVSTATPVRVRFSEPMNESSAEAAVSIAGPGSPAILSPGWVGDDLVFQTSGLRLESMYTVTVAPTVRDSSDPGNPLAAPHSFTFNTSDAPVPVITLGAPNGGELLVAGDAFNITWSASGGTGALAVDLSFSSTGPGGPWTPLASDLAGNGSFAWTVPDVPSTDCYINATVADGGTPRKEASDLSDGPLSIRSRPRPVNLTLLAPNGGEVWLAGSRQVITWNASGGTGDLTVFLQFSGSGAGGPWTALSSGEANDGSFEWTVPDAPGARCFILARAEDGDSPPVSAEDTGDAPFTIKARPDPLSVRLTSPNGGENWTRLSRHDITWTASGGNGNLSVRLELSTSGRAGPWLPVASDIPSSGRHVWTVPDAPSDDCFVRVTVTDSYDPPQNASDLGDAPFRISVPFTDGEAPSVAILSPVQGALLKGVCQIRVNATDNVGVAWTEVLIDGAVAANISSGEVSFDWNTSLAADGNHTILARARDAAGNAGESAAITVTVKNSVPQPPPPPPKQQERSFLEANGALVGGGVVAIVILVALLAVLRLRRKD